MRATFPENGREVKNVVAPWESTSPPIERLEAISLTAAGGAMVLKVL
jgi:hypothetical protein